MIKRIGNFDFLESGSAIVHPGDSLVLEVGGLNLTIGFADDVRSDSPLGIQTIKPSIDAKGEGKELFLVIRNFNLKSGYGTVKPLPVGIVNSRKLYLKFVVQVISVVPIAKLFNYNFILGEHV